MTHVYHRTGHSYVRWAVPTPHAAAAPAAREVKDPAALVETQTHSRNVHKPCTPRVITVKSRDNPNT